VESVGPVCSAAFPGPVAPVAPVLPVLPVAPVVLKQLSMTDSKPASEMISKLLS